jgi:hypothetical protein
MKNSYSVLTNPAFEIPKSLIATLFFYEWFSCLFGLCDLSCSLSCLKQAKIASQHPIASS